MKKSKLTRGLMAAGSVVALSAVLYGCGGGGGGEPAIDYEAMLAALNEAAMAELGEDETLTPEAIAAIIAARDAADAAAAAATAAQMTAEGERDAANMAAAAAAEAQATAEAARDAANMAAAAAAEAQATAEGERDAANMAAAAAAEAQATAEAARDAANMAAAAAAEAQATAEGERDAANMAAAAAAEAQATAEAARDAANMAAAAAAEAQGLAEGERDAANTAAAAAAAAQATAEGERDAANTAAAAAAAAQMTAEGERDAANTAAAAAAAAQATAEGERDAANMAAAAAAEAQATAEGERDAANMAAAAAAEAQTTAEGERDAANMAAAAAEERAETAEAELADVKEKAADVLAKLAADEATAMAKAVLAAIGTNVELGSQPDAPVVELGAGSDGMMTAEQEGYTRADTDPEPISGFRSAMLTNDDGDTTVIYSDVSNAVATRIGEIYAASSAPGEPAVYDVVADVTTDANRHDIPWAAAKRGNLRETTSGTGDAAVTTFTGSVGGLAGTFTCMSDTCEAPTENEDGALEGFEGEWTFKPDNPSGTIDVDDGTYVSFGWWLNAMGEDAYVFDAFASATGMTANTEQGSDLEGSATYTGGAAGKWAVASTTSDSVEGGHFTATATLTANFDADSDGADANDENGVSVSGAITDFDTGDDVSRDSWKVTLMPVDTQPGTDGLQTVTQVGPITDGVTAWDTGGAVDGAGGWTADFYGTEAETSHPTAVTGEFDAGIGGGDIARVAGAFGATK